MENLLIVLAAACFGLCTIPFVLDMGLPGWETVLLVVPGVLLGLTVMVYLSPRVFGWLDRRAETRAEAKGEEVQPSRASRALAKAGPRLNDSGEWSFAFIAPLLFGALGSGLLCPALGISRRRSLQLLWTAVIVWGVVMTVALVVIDQYR